MRVEIDDCPQDSSMHCENISSDNTDSDTNCIPLPNAKEAVFAHISITQEAVDKIQIETKH